VADYLDSLRARGVISDDAAASAQDARDAAAWRTRQSVQPDEGRQEGAATAYLDRMGGRLRDDLADIGDQALHRPEEFATNLATGGELGVMRSGATVGLFRELLRSGKSIEEAAAHLGITPRAAQALARGGGVPKNGMTGVFDVPGAVERFKDLASQRKLAGQIAREFGVSAPTVRAKARELGIDLQRGETVVERSARIKRESAGPEGTPSAPAAPRPSEDNERPARMLFDLMHQGWTDHELAAEFGVSPEEIAGKRPVLQRKYGKERALFFDVFSKMDDHEIAAEYGMSPDEIRNKRLDLERKYGK
jgi:hypothetical protein